MVYAASLMQALFRGFWTRRRYTWLRMMEDKEMSFQNRQFRGLALMQAEDVRRSIDLQAGARPGENRPRSAVDPDADDPSPERRPSTQSTQDPQEGGAPFRDPADYARPDPPPYPTAVRPPRTECEDPEGYEGEIEDMAVDDLGEEGGGVPDEEGVGRAPRHSRSSSFAWTTENQEEDIVEVLTDCGGDDFNSTRASGVYATAATGVTHRCPTPRPHPRPLPHP